MDRISNLPNEIICHIVSFISAKEAIFTSVLSKRFLNPYNIIPNLEFDDNMVKTQGSLTDLLDGVLALPASSRIRKFSLKCSKWIEPAQYAHVNHCLCGVLKHGVLDLELVISVNRHYSLPSEVFTCKTVVNLKLGSVSWSFVVVDVLPENAYLPALETLVLKSIIFEDLCGCAFEKLLSACHVLKELIIYGMEWKSWKSSSNISSPTLQRLTIDSKEVIDFGKGLEYGSMGIALDTPSLTYFKCSDVVPDEYPVVNLDSLVKAELDLMLTVDHIYDGCVYENEIMTSNPTNLIKGLRNVQIMNLTSPTTFQTFYHFNEAIPVFETLYHLTITPEDEETCWDFLPFLLKKAPNLETLIINGPLHYDQEQPKSICKCLSGYSVLLSCPLTVLQITEYNGTTGEVVQLKLFLEKLSCLKLVKLRSTARRGSDKEKLMISRAPSKCTIKVTFS